MHVSPTTSSAYGYEKHSIIKISDEKPGSSSGNYYSHEGPPQSRGSGSKNQRATSNSLLRRYNILDTNAK
jgi:hypothetical protein